MTASLSEAQRTTVTVIAIASLVLAITLPGVMASFNLEFAKTELLTNLQARGHDLSANPGAAMSRCVFQENNCRNWFFSKLVPPNWRNFSYGLGIFGTVPLLILASSRPKRMMYSAGFAARDELNDMRHANWERNNDLDTAILIGFHHPLPKDEPLRDLVIRGIRLPNVDRCLTAISPGYGGRIELGHYIVYGSTRAGKSVHGVAQLGHWKDSAITLDIKGELYDATAGLRQTYGRVFTLGPSGEGNQYDPVSALMEIPGGVLVAAELITRPKLQKRPEFALKAAAGLAAMFMAAKILGNIAPFDAVEQVIAGGGVNSFLDLVMSADNRAVRRQANIFVGLTAEARVNDETLKELTQKEFAKYKKELSDQASNDGFLTSAWGLMVRDVQPFMSEEMRWTLRKSDFVPKDFYDQTTTLYIKVPNATVESFSPVYNLIIASLIRGMSYYWDTQRDPVKDQKRVLAFFDEASRAPVQDLEDILATAASAKITAGVYLQSPAQFKIAYDEATQESVSNNASAELFYNSNTPATHKAIEELCHKVSVETESRSRKQWAIFDRPTITRSSAVKSVFTAAEARLLGGASRQLLLAKVTGQRPFIAQRLNYYEHGIGKLMKRLPPPDIPKADLNQQNLISSKSPSVSGSQPNSNSHIL